CALQPRDAPWSAQSARRGDCTPAARDRAQPEEYRSASQSLGRVRLAGEAGRGGCRGALGAEDSARFNCGAPAVGPAPGGARWTVTSLAFDDYDTPRLRDTE